MRLQNIGYGIFYSKLIARHRKKGSPVDSMRNGTTATYTLTLFLLSDRSLYGMLIFSRGISEISLCVLSEHFSKGIFELRA